MQNEMTMVMVMIGATIICLVLVYNFWQGMRFKRKKRAAAEAAAALGKSDQLEQSDEFSQSIQNQSSDTQTAYQSDDEDADEQPWAATASVLHEDNQLDQPADDEAVTQASVGEISADDYQLDTDEIATQEVMQQSTSANAAASASPAAALTGNSGAADKPASNVSHLHALPANLSRDVDSIVKFSFASALNGATLDGATISQALAAHPVPEGINKPVQILLQGNLVEWLSISQLTPDYSCSAMLVALQLVNRDGAVSAEAIQQFVDWVASLQQQLDVPAEWLTHTAIAADANALDQFCLSVDKTLKLHIMHGAAGRFTGTKLRGLAESSGLNLEQGIFCYTLKDGRVAYTLENMEMNPFNPYMLRTVVLKGVTLKLDIPRTAKCSEHFDHMLATAKKMQAALNAVLVDEQMREISEAQLERIRQQIKLIETQMQARGMPPGSDLALRLFS